MTQQWFSEIIEERVKKIKNTLDIKGKEYANTEDRLHNFKQAALFMGTIPEKSLWGFNAKHIISIQDMLNDLSSGIINPVEKWEEKIGDAINYMILLEALIKERIYNNSMQSCIKEKNNEK